MYCTYAILTPMKSGLNPKGFTIVETMIFLAVSAALLTSALALLSGSQNKTQFNQAINDVQQQINTISNNVANGYYPSIGNLDCQDNVASTTLSISTGGPNERGTNVQCTFIGRVVLFNQNSDTFIVYNVAGARKKIGTTLDVANMVDAKPTVIDGSEEINLKYGLRVGRMRVIGGSNVGAVGFFTGFGKTNASGGLESSSIRSDFMGIPGTNLSTSGAALPALIHAGPFRPTYQTNKNPIGGIEICFESGTTNQLGVLTIGGEGRTSSTTLRIATGACSALP